MNIPGFNADASLYTMSERYQMAVPLSQDPEAIYPQLIGKSTLGRALGFLCFVACYGTCRLIGGDPHDCTIGCSSLCGVATVAQSDRTTLV
jgi:hypothetical protein